VEILCVWLVFILVSLGLAPFFDLRFNVGFLGSREGSLCATEVTLQKYPSRDQPLDVQLECLEMGKIEADGGEWRCLGNIMGLHS
jgi:hypothetical protein